MAKTKKSKRMAKAILETAKDLMKGGLLDKKTYKKITMRHMNKEKEKLPKIKEIKPDEIKEIREKAHLSQAVFAQYLHLTVGYVSQLERGTKHPSGPALVLLNAIQRKGFKAILQ